MSARRLPDLAGPILIDEYEAPLHSSMKYPPSTKGPAHPYFDWEYINQYNNLYIKDSFWRPKYLANKSIIKYLLSQVKPGVWLDLFCGQAQYFELASDRNDIQCVGIDYSPAQLEIARQKYMSARFKKLNIAKISLCDHLADVVLVTAMWAGYGYLNSLAEIENWLGNVKSVMNKDSVFYLEIIEPSTLLAHNQTEFSSAHRVSTNVVNIDFDCVEWSYVDAGGEHCMLAPTVDWFQAACLRLDMSIAIVHCAQTLHQALITLA